MSGMRRLVPEQGNIKTKNKETKHQTLRKFPSPHFTFSLSPMSRDQLRVKETVTMIILMQVEGFKVLVKILR